MAEEPQDQIEEGEDVEKLLGEFGSLYAALTKHQRPMAILFADLKGSTAIFGERSDLEGLLFVQRSESLIRPAVERHSGNVVKTIGDAVMASFPSADDAVLAAITIQHALVEHNRELSADDRLSLRIGVNTGKGFVKDQDIFGQVVNIAAKLQDEALGDQILVSQATLEALGTELARLAGGSRSLEVRGVTHPIEICEIRWQEGPEPKAMPAPARAPVTARAPREEPVAVEAEPAAPPKETRRSGLGLGAAAAVVALLLVGGGLYMMSGSSTKGRQAPPSKATASSPAVAAKKPPLTRAQVQRILTTSKNLDFQNLSGLNLQTIDLTGASLKGSDLTGVNLSGARLERANLAEANLRRANLAKADLKGADLTRANLAEANLAGAQFWGGNLAGADLRGANAAGANFPHASLKGADFSKADLRGANFFEANLEGARFTGANLGDIQNIWRAKNTDKAIDLKLE